MQAAPFFAPGKPIHVTNDFDDFDQWLENADDADPISSFTRYQMFPSQPKTSYQSNYLREVSLESPKTPTPKHGRNSLPIAASNNSPTVPPTFTPINKHAQTISHHFSPKNLPRSPLQDRFKNRYDLSQSPATIQDGTLLSTSVLPDSLRSLFPFAYFNPMQSKSFHSLYACDNNIVLSAPTGSGKTTCFELAIARLMKQDSGGEFKVIYISPTKSLCQERVRDWTKRFAGFSLRCDIPANVRSDDLGGELTGDTEERDTSVLRENHIIITTPEKWDSVTRKMKDYRRLVEMIRLLLVDEVHLLNDDRGATLEVVITRMKLLPGLRVIAVSATAPNLEDLGRWLGHDSTGGRTPVGNVSHCEGSAITLAFGEEYRPVKLETHCYGFTQHENENDFQFEKVLNGELMQIILRHSSSKPTLIFCSTKKGAQQAAQAIVSQYDSFRKVKQSPPWRVNREELEPFVNTGLEEMVKKGVGYHHAGLDLKDRALIEQLFLNGQLLALCSTGTLAVGVNLPAHLVIIRNTLTYRNGEMVDLNDSEILQMIGRAGRPQFDDTGVAVILTRSDKLQKYENIAAGKQALESRLHQQLAEHINAEIGLGTITDLESAKKWLCSTFFYVRCGSNPSHYGIASHNGVMEETVEEKCITVIESLKREGLVQDVGGRLQNTAYGNATARYCVRLQTMSRILNTPGDAKLKDILETLSRAEEFICIRLRSGEKSFYNSVVNQNYGIRYQFKSSGKGSQPVEETWHKVSLLIQCELGLADFAEQEKVAKHKPFFWSMNQDKAYVLQHSLRIAKCMRDCYLHRREAASLLAIVTLERCLRARTWHDLPGVLRQLKGLGPAYVRTLALRGIKSFEKLRQTEPEELEVWCKRSTPFGREILKSLERVPKYQLEVNKRGQVTSQDGIKVKFAAKLNILNNRIDGRENSVVAANRAIFVAVMGSSVRSYETFPHSALMSGKEFKFEVVFDQPGQIVNCYLGCEWIVGCEVEATCDPDLSTSAFVRHSGQKVSSIVRRQPTITELVNKAMNVNNPLMENTQATNRQANSTRTGKDLDFEHLREASGQDFALEPTIPAQPTNKKRKRTNSVEDAFPDIRVDDLELDENDLKVLDGLESPEKLANGNYRCNHACKDRTKCKHLCCKEGKTTKPKKGRQSLPKQSKTGLQTATVKKGTISVQNPPQNPMSKESHTQNKLLSKDHIFSIERVEPPKEASIPPPALKPFFRRWTIDSSSSIPAAAESAMDIDDDDDGLPDLAAHFSGLREKNITNIARQSEDKVVDTSYSQKDAPVPRKENHVDEVIPIMPSESNKQRNLFADYDFSVEAIFQCVEIVD